MLYKHKKGLHISSCFSEDARFRYLLVAEDQNKSEGKTICVIMQNPSDADDEKADKSVQFLEHLIFDKGYNEFQDVRKMIIVNQYAYIQKHNFTGETSLIGEKNNRIINESIEESDIVLIAWGKKNPYEERKEFVLRILEKIDDKLLLETKKHPSRGFYRDFIKPLQLNPVAS